MRKNSQPLFREIEHLSFKNDSKHVTYQRGVATDLMVLWVWMSHFNSLSPFPGRGSGNNNGVGTCLTLWTVPSLAPSRGFLNVSWLSLCATTAVVIL